MLTAPDHPQEAERLEALQRYKVLDTEAEKTFDDLVFLTAHIFQTPIAMVSLVDEHRQWFKARVGLEASETPRDVAFCAHAIVEDEVLIVPDAHDDKRFADNPLVTGDPNVRFYAGAQLRSAEGLPLGTLCAIDREPRQLSEGQIKALEILARQVVTQMDLRLALRRVKEFQQRREEQAEHDTRMLQILAHDLRNPMSAVVGLAELLAADIATISGAEARAILHDLTIATQAVVGLLDNILAWALLESGALRPRFTPLKLGLICARVVETLDQVIRNKELRVEQAIDAELRLDADPTMLQSIVQNLLTNAIKFTPHGGSIALRSRGDDGHVVLEVADSGEGMSAEQAAALNRGEAVDSRRGTDGEAGSGLGFQIVRDFTRAHEGQLTVRSTPGEGTTVELRLPLRPPSS